MTYARLWLTFLILSIFFFSFFAIASGQSCFDIKFDGERKCEKVCSSAKNSCLNNCPFDSRYDTCINLCRSEDDTCISSCDSESDAAYNECLEEQESPPPPPPSPESESEPTPIPEEAAPEPKLGRVEKKLPPVPPTGTGEEATSPVDKEQTTKPERKGEYSDAEADRLGKEGGKKENGLSPENCSEGFLSTKEILEKCYDSETGLYLGKPKIGGAKEAKARAEEFVEPFFTGGPPEGCVSNIGYPTLSCFSGDEFQIQGCSNGDGICLINTNTGTFATLEGIGITMGDPVALPPINPSNLDQKSISKKGQEPKYTAEVQGADEWADPIVENKIDPKTGEETLIVKLNPKTKEEILAGITPSPEAEGTPEEVSKATEDALEKIRVMKIVVKKDGEVIAEIPLVVDLQEPKEEKDEKKSKPTSFSFWWIILILLGLGVGYVTLIKRKGE